MAAGYEVGLGGGFDGDELACADAAGVVVGIGGYFGLVAPRVAVQRLVTALGPMEKQMELLSCGEEGARIFLERD